VPQNELLYPIQAGAAIADKKIENMLYDDTGINISKKNRSYCEMTAIYWAWKNDVADYYGFFHYRRYLSFSDTVFPANPFAEVIFNNNRDIVKKTGLLSDTMRNIIEKHDVIVPRKGGFAERYSMYNHYKVSKLHKIKDFDFILNYIKNKYPEMTSACNIYMHAKTGYFCNMFIMKRDIFYAYCKWVFDILEHFENNTDISNYDIGSYRVLGFLAERLTGIYLCYILADNNYKYLELQRILFENTDKITVPKPLGGNDVVIVLAANNFYAPYASVLLQTIMQYGNKNRNFDIIITHKDITQQNINILNDQFSMYPNFSIRFFNMSGYMEDYNNLYVRGHFKIETYFRLFIQDILSDYDKAVYLDCDMIVKADISPLFDTDVEGYLLAACLDADTIGLYNGADPQRKDYTDNILKLKNPYNYFQAGVIVYNLKEFRNSFSTKSVLEFALSNNWHLMDQDILNFFAQGRVKFIDMAWNVFMDWRNIRINEQIKLAPINLYLSYMESRKNPKIIHFAGPEKPWEVVDMDFADQFWAEARKSPLYEFILARMAEWVSIQNFYYYSSFKHRIILPFVNRCFPYKSRRRIILKKIYYKLRRLKFSDAN
jgi:lipopolysaccharide biosynthesis glycosyltransferase